ESAFRVLNISAIYHQPRIDKVIVMPGNPTAHKPYAFIPLAIVQSIYDSDPRGYFSEGNVINHVHNSAGWRDREHSVKKPPHTYRILGLGDSYLWGQGVKYKDIVLSKLEQLLSVDAFNMTIETVNTGISSTNTHDQLELLKYRGLQYDPDLIIVHFVLNDVEEDLDGKEEKIEFFRDYTSLYQSPDKFSKYSYLYGWVRQRYQLTYRARHYIKNVADSFLEDSSKWAQCREALLGIHNVCRSHNIQLLIVVFPFFHNLDGDYPFQVIHDTVRTFLEENDIHVLDLRNHFQGFHGPELWVHPTDQHPNEIAHDIAAKVISGYIKDNFVAFIPAYQNN
ncbi:MAG: SGNH/GDSL hydrolase family protein, partial [Planctomycetota bacterium]